MYYKYILYSIYLYYIHTHVCVTMQYIMYIVYYVHSILCSIYIHMYVYVYIQICAIYTHIHTHMNTHTHLAHHERDIAVARSRHPEGGAQVVFGVYRVLSTFLHLGFRI